MDINISDNKYSNVEVTNTTRINNFNFGNYENLVHINNVINTDSNGIITLNKSNTTYVINSTTVDTRNNMIYKKLIPEVQKLKKDTFISNNHNLKINDKIRLHDIKKNNIDILNSSVINKDFMVNNVTRNTFTLIASNGVTDILKTSCSIDNGYFEIIDTEYQSNIKKLYNKNNGIYKNKIENLYNEENGIITYTDEEGHNYDIYNNKIVNINIENNDDNIGTYYNILVNTSISSLTINCLNNDKLNGYVTINNKHLIGVPYTEIAENKSKLVLDNIDLKYSYYKLVNISKNNWYIEGNVYSNIINLKLTYKDNFKLNNISKIHEFYLNYIYVIDISDTSLSNYIFTIVKKNMDYRKNILQFGSIGQPNSYLYIYIDKNEVLNNIYELKYKLMSQQNFFNYISLYIIKDTPKYFI